MTAVTLTLDPLIQLTDAKFRKLCHANPDVKLERTAQGELVV
jgi:Uma2 family endonuclease